jgi:DNA-binding CsgD family transcriptional regulator
VQAEPDESLLRLMDGAGGNPFLLVELLYGVREEGLVRVEHGHASIASGQVPDRVRVGMRERLDRLSEFARRIALIAGSLGRTFSFSELTAMLDVPPAELLTASDELIRAGILRERGDGLAFQHDLTRDGVRGVTGRSARRALDRQAAAVLLSRGALPVDVAGQLAASAEPGDAAAVATLHEAAQALGSSDPGAAADLSRRALELASSVHPLRGPLVAQTTILLHAAARSHEAKTFADEHLRAALSVAEESELLLSVASMFALGPDERADANRRALALPGLTSASRARHLARLAYNLIQAGRHGEADWLLSQVRDEVMAHADAASSTILQHIDSLLLCHEGRFARALETHEAALRDGFGRGEGTRQRVANLWWSDLLGQVDRLEESMELAVDGIASAQRDRQAWALDYFETWRGRQLFLQGKLADAAAALDGRFEPEDADKIAGMYAGGLATLGRIAIHTEDQEVARATADVARVMVATGTPGTARHGAWLLALQAMAAGDPQAACRLLRSEDQFILPMHPIDVTDGPHLVRVALAGGDHELAVRAVGLAEQHAARSPEIGSVVAAAAHARGLLDDDTSELVRAVERFGAAPRPLAHASALEDLGATRLRGQSRSDGVQALQDALAVYVGTGASWDARRVRARLRAHGVRRRVAATDRPADDWSALTDSELAVVRLVSEGRTNREVAERLFVSPHTVNSHLRRAFSKLGVNSRVELARLAAHRPATDA